MPCSTILLAYEAVLLVIRSYGNVFAIMFAFACRVAMLLYRRVADYLPR